MPTLTGFNAKQEKIIRKAMVDAEICIDAVLEQVFASTGKFTTRAEKYFSSSGVGGWDYVTTLVLKTVSSMKLVLKSDLYSIVNEVDQSKAPSTNAAACSWKQNLKVKKSEPAHFQGTMVFNNVRMNVLEAQMEHVNKTQAPSPMTIYPLFWKLPYSGKDKQSQVQSFLHELSHVAAGTVDIDQPSCYGMSGVKYCKQKGQSAQNAENIAMFLASYL